jgi:predicted site-specific integrase-resolvase
MAPPFVDDPLLTQTQVCIEFAISLNTLKRWRATGKIKCVILGPRSVRYRRSEIERVKADCERENGNAGVPQPGKLTHAA